MKVSVIICAYNAETTIGRTIESILGQSYKNIEIVIIDDGSKDGTFAVIEEYQKKNPAKIVVKSIPNGGLSNARNHALDMVTGEFFLNLDADDYIESDTLEKAVAVVTDNEQIDMCFWGAKYFDESGKYFYSYSKNRLYPDEPITGVEAFQQWVKGKYWFYQGSAIYKTAVVRENNLRNHPGLNQGEDFYFISRFLFCAKLVFCFRGDNFCYMQRSDSMNNSIFNYSFFQVPRLLEILKEDVKIHHEKLLGQIQPYISAEQIIQWLAIIKRLVRCLTFKNYLQRVKEPVEQLKTVDKDEAWAILSKQKKLEYVLCSKSVTLFYYISKLYDNIKR